MRFLLNLPNDNSLDVGDTASRNIIQLSRSWGIPPTKTFRTCAGRALAGPTKNRSTGGFAMDQALALERSRPASLWRALILPALVGGFRMDGLNQKNENKLWWYPQQQQHRHSYHMAAPVTLARQQTTPEPSGTFWTLPPEPTPTRAGNQHAPEPSGTFQDLPEPTFRNLPEPASGTYTCTRRNSPEPSGTFLRNLLLRPAPAHTGPYLGWRPH